MINIGVNYYTLSITTAVGQLRVGGRPSWDLKQSATSWVMHVGYILLSRCYVTMRWKHGNRELPSGH